MSTSRFETFLTRMGKLGFEMDPRVQQKDINGLLGMHATESIPKGTLLGKFPLSMMIPRSDSVDFSEDPNGDIQSLIHAMATQLADKNSPYQGYFEFCGTVSERESRSVCFFTPQDFAILNTMNPLLAKLAQTSKMQWEYLVHAVCTKDPSLDKQHVLLASLIYRERCWGGSLGFLPGMDLFNHNTKSNIFPQRVQFEDGESIAFITDKDIAPGEEIKITYGKKDIFQFSFNYDFFDPTDFHIISFSSRIKPTLSDAFVQKVCENLKKHYDIRIFEEDGSQKFMINESRAFFLEQGPNTAMVELVSRLAINDEAALKRGSADEKTAARYMLYILQSYKQANNVKNVPKASIPEKLHSFHDMLTAELDILDANIRVIQPKCA